MCVGSKTIRIWLGMRACEKPLLPLGDVLLFYWCFAYSMWCVWGGTNVMYGVRFGKESLARSLSVSSIVHVEEMFCLGRRGGEIGDGGSDLGLFF